MNASAALTAASQESDPFVAMDHLRYAVRSHEKLGARWAEAIMLAARLQDDDTAAAAGRRLLAETPPSAMTAFIAACALEATGKADEGADLLLPWAKTGRLPAKDAHRLGRMLCFSNRFAEAEAVARALIAQQPENAHYWQLLTHAKRFTARDADVVAMEGLQRTLREAPAPARIAIGYALGKVYVDLGDDAAAATAIEAATRARLSSVSFDANSIEESERDALAAYRERSVRRADEQVGANVVFILGPPRSGTTLVEQILTSHPQMRGGGELKFMWVASQEIGRVTPARVLGYEEQAHTQGRDPWETIGRRYLAFGELRFGAGARFTDKLLTNHWRLGIVRWALPGAHIVRVHRDPMDVAWSCWRTNLDVESVWSCSPDLVARYIASYERLMDAWASEFPIHELSYEQLVRDPEAQIPTLLRACGVDDHPATRHPEALRRTVSTSSFAQVREPISASRAGAAGGFPISTSPLRAALEKIGLKSRK